jgi:aminomethyltransferase
MVPFGGWEMPVQYAPGIVKEHKTVREAVGLFDVSHMGQIAILGPHALAVVQKLITNDASILSDGAAQYTVMCNPSGGIIDDCIVYRRSAHDFLMVVNASNIDKDRTWVEEVANNDAVVVDESEATALLAVQGPLAVDLVARMAHADLGAVPRFHFSRCRVAGVSCLAARTGYTGEDGFELACPAEASSSLWGALLEAGAPIGIRPIGLGARDTLRLEARLCLYGNDIDDTTSPLEAGLGWTVRLDAKEFVGKAALQAQKRAGLQRKLIGFRVEGRSIARHNYAILDRRRGTDATIGRVTSGNTGITVGGAIGMGYVPTEYAEAGSLITIDCRGKDATAIVVTGPFYRRG